MSMRIALTTAILTIALVLASISQATAGVIATVELPGVQSTTVSPVITESFNSILTGSYTSLVTAVGTITASAPGAVVISADQYGGAGGVGLYLAVGNQSLPTTSATLALNGPQSYFGMWWSAVDRENFVQLYSGGTSGTLLATYDNTTSPIAGLASSYFGNPNSGLNTIEPYVYVNFFGTSGTTFDTIVFGNYAGGTGFEMDNFSVRTPEPASMTMLGVGIAGMAGYGWRRRKQAAIA